MKKNNLSETGVLTLSFSLPKEINIELEKYLKDNYLTRSEYLRSLILSDLRQDRLL